MDSPAFPPGRSVDEREEEAVGGFDLCISCDLAAIGGLWNLSFKTYTTNWNSAYFCVPRWFFYPVSLHPSLPKGSVIKSSSQELSHYSGKPSPSGRMERVCMEPSALGLGWDLVDVITAEHPLGRPVNQVWGAWECQHYPECQQLTHPRQSSLPDL